MTERQERSTPELILRHSVLNVRFETLLYVEMSYFRQSRIDLLKDCGKCPLGRAPKEQLGQFLKWPHPMIPSHDPIPRLNFNSLRRCGPFSSRPHCEKTDLAPLALTLSFIQHRLTFSVCSIHLPIRLRGKHPPTSHHWSYVAA